MRNPAIGTVPAPRRLVWLLAAAAVFSGGCRPAEPARPPIPVQVATLHREPIAVETRLQCHGAGTASHRVVVQGSGDGGRVDAGAGAGRQAARRTQGRRGGRRAEPLSGQSLTRRTTGAGSRRYRIGWRRRRPRSGRRRRRSRPCAPPSSGSSRCGSANGFRSRCSTTRWPSATRRRPSWTPRGARSARLRWHSARRRTI